MQVRGPQLKQLQEALISAFPTRQALERVVLYGLDQQLGAIAGNDSLEHTVFQLLQWVGSQNKWKELIVEAVKCNGQNPQLADIAQQLLETAPPSNIVDEGSTYRSGLDITSIQGKDDSLRQNRNVSAKAKTSQSEGRWFGLVTSISEDHGNYLQQALRNELELEVVSDQIDSLCGLEKDQLERVKMLLPYTNLRIERIEMEAMPQLKLIATRSSACDHIDLDYAKKKGIAEYTFALLLTLSRKLYLPYALAPQGFDLYGKTLGVVGAGEIGLRVIRIAKGFGMNVLAYDEVEQRRYSELLGFRYVPFEELLEKANIVSLHIPALLRSDPLIDQRALTKMKQKGVLLISTSRASLIDAKAVVRALDNGILGGVALDVPEAEELQAIFGVGQQLRGNVILTSYNALNSVETPHYILETTVENVKCFLKRRRHNRVV